MIFMDKVMSRNKLGFVISREEFIKGIWLKDIPNDGDSELEVTYRNDFLSIVSYKGKKRDAQE